MDRESIGRVGDSTPGSTEVNESFAVDYSRHRIGTPVARGARAVLGSKGEKKHAAEFTGASKLPLLHNNTAVSGIPCIAPVQRSHC